MKNIRDEVKNLFENDDNEKSDKKDEDLELLLDDEQLAEGDSSVEEDNLFDKCQKSCDDSYEKCDASCEGNVECENDCMDVYNQCGANCEDLDNIDEAVDKALKEQLEEDIDDKILFWVNSEKLDELLHKHFSPGYEGDYYVLSDLDWQKFQDVASSNGFDQEEDYDEAYDLSGKLTQHGKFIREAKDPKAPRVMNIKWKRGGVLGPRASKIPEDVFQEFLDQGRDDSVILSWLSRKFRGIPVSFEWTTFKGSPIKEQFKNIKTGSNLKQAWKNWKSDRADNDEPLMKKEFISFMIDMGYERKEVEDFLSPIKEQRDEYGSVVFVKWDTDNIDSTGTENVGTVPPNKVPLPKDVYLEIEKQALDNWGEEPETIEDEQASEDFINEKIKSWLEYEYHWIVKKWSWVPFKIKEHKEKISDDEKWKAPSGRTIDRKVTIRLLNMPQHSIISQADQDALGISRRDHETVRDALRRAEFEDTVKEWKETGEPDINDVDDEETRTREDDDSKMEHDEEPTEISKEEFDQKAKSGKQIGRASERGHILTPRGDVVFHDGPTFLTNDRELVFYDDWSKKYYKIENFGDNLEELERKTDEYYEKEKEKRGFEDDEYYDDVAPHPEERRYDDVDEDNGEDIDEGKNMTRNLKTEVKKLFEVNDSESEKKDPKKYPFSLQVMRNHKWVDHLYFKTEKEANDKKDEYLEDPYNKQADLERYRVKERTLREKQPILQKLFKSAIANSDYDKDGGGIYFFRSLDEHDLKNMCEEANIRYNGELAKKLLGKSVVAVPKESSYTTSGYGDIEIRFFNDEKKAYNVYKSSASGFYESKKTLKEDVEVNIPQRGDFAIAELSPQEKQEAIWQFAGECADVIEKLIESNVSIRGVYGYEVPRKAEVMHAKLFDFILAEIDRS